MLHNMGMVETITCKCHGENQVDVRSWPEKNIVKGKVVYIPTNHYFCRITGDGETECEVTITNEISQ